MLIESITYLPSPTICHAYAFNSGTYLPILAHQQLWRYGTKGTGVTHRNMGMQWVREHCSFKECNGVVYFGDDDDKYDLRFFEEVSFD